MARYVLSPTLPATFTFTNIAWYIYNIYFHQHCLAHLHLFSPTLVHLHHLFSPPLPGTTTSTFTNIAWYIYIYLHQHCLVHLHHLFSSPFAWCNYIYFHQYCLVQLQHLPGTSTNTYFHQYCLVQHLLSPILLCTTTTPAFTNTALYNNNICLV